MEVKNSEPRRDSTVDDRKQLQRMDSSDTRPVSRLEVLEEEEDRLSGCDPETVTTPGEGSGVATGRVSLSSSNATRRSIMLRHPTSCNGGLGSGSHSGSVHSRHLSRPSVISLAAYPESSDVPLETPGGGSVWPQLYVTLAVSCGSLMVGFSAAWTAPALVSLQSTESSLPVTANQASWIGALMPLSALCGGILGGALLEPLGRRATVAITALPFLLSYVLIATATHVAMLYVGRALTGLGVGVLSLAIPVYLSEVLESQIRGTLAVLPTTIGNLGILICFLAGSYMRWDQLAALGAAWPILFIILLWFVPETPRWYMNRGREDEAAQALRKVRGRHANTTAELDTIRHHIIDTRMSRRESLKNLTSPLHLRALAIALALMCFQQFSGINAVIFYTVGIFEAAGSSVDSNLCSIIVGVVNLAATLMANVLIDRLGRRVLLIVSSVMMCASLFTLGAFFYIRQSYENSDQESAASRLGWLPLVCFMVYVVAFSLGWGPVPWLYLGEGLPSRIRGPAGSCAAAFSWVCTFVVTKTFNDMQHALGAAGVFWLFGAVTLAGLLFVVPVLTEMKGRSLEEIERDMMLYQQRLSSGSVASEGAISVPIGIHRPQQSETENGQKLHGSHSENVLGGKAVQKTRPKSPASPQNSCP